MVKESVFRSHADKFVKEVVKMQGARLVDTKFVYTDTVSSIELFMIGKEISDDTLSKWQNKMASYRLANVHLDVYGIGESNRGSDFEILSGKLKETILADVVKQLYMFNQEEIQTHEKQIAVLENELIKLKPRDLKMANLAKEMKIQFENLERISYAETLESDFSSRVDTIATILVKWRNGIKRSVLEKDEDKIQRIMQIRLELDTVRVIQY